MDHPAAPPPASLAPPPTPAARRARLWIPYVVLVATLAVTAGAALFVWSAGRARDRARFDRLVERTETNVVRRLETYVNMLRAGGGMFAGSHEVSADDWHAFVDRLQLEERYPGIQGVGFSARVRAEERDDLVAWMRDQGFTDFAIDPSGDRDEYHAIVYLEPLDARNRRALGFDMYTERTRREAMARARDTGEPAASGRVTLVQEVDDADPQAGFLIYVPVYEGGSVPSSRAERRERLHGLVYSPFRADDLLAGIFGAGGPDELRFAVYDGTEVTEAALMHRLDPGQATGTSTSGNSRAPAAAGGTPKFATQRQMNVEGRPWTVTYETGPGFAAGAAPAVTPLVLIGGTAVSLILFALARALARAAEAAERSAEGLRQSGAALRASEARFRRLFESNVVGVSFSDLGGRVIDGNDAYFRMLGYPKSEFTSGRLGWDQIIPPEYREADARALEQLRSTGECPPFEKEYVRADGSRVPVLVGVALLDAASGECVTLNVDLTERKQAEERMRAATEAAEAARQSAEAARQSAEAARAEAEHANRIKDEFLATVSHELRTPLNAVLGWAQLLRGADSEPDDLAQGLETIERNARAQAQLIDDLLDVSRIVAGKLRLDVRTVDLAPVIEAAVDACRHAADAKGVHLTRVLDPQAGPVAGDPDRLQQVMWNLVANAVKFTPRGGRVQVVLRRVESTAEITVSDTGQGIDPAFLPHVFDRFRQADASITRLHGGLGIGLSIVRNLVELHGGTVRASSPGPGGGAAFTVALPVAVSRDPLDLRDDRRARTAEADCPPLSLKGVRVLVVDDDPDARHLLARVLRDCDADVAMAASAAEAFEGFERTAPDVIVSDIGMPGEDGYSLIRRIRATEAARGANTPAVALTAFARPEDRRRAVLAGYQVHLPKPVEPGELRAVVANLVGRAPAHAGGPT